MIKIRCCVLCKSRKNKSELLRIVAHENGNAILDESQNINKRGIYLCKNKECIERYIKAIKKGKINLKIKVNLESLTALLESLEVGMGE